jgi:hypothetical protein
MHGGESTGPRTLAELAQLRAAATRHGRCTAVERAFERLEHLFDAVSTALGEDGRFVIYDIIGRNGHLRWPEAGGGGRAVLVRTAAVVPV